MSKIQQALEYEHRLAEDRDAHNYELANLAIAYERKLTDSQIEGAVRVRDEAFAYERKITDLQFTNIDLVNEEHRHYHDREHILYEDAIEKASSALQTQLKILESDTDRMRDASTSYLTIDRFEREHQTLIEKTETAVKNLESKLGVEEKVTIRQETTQQLLNRIASNNRWIIGLIVGAVASIGAAALHFAGFL